MKRQIRRGVFETNSSSTHSITMCSEKSLRNGKMGRFFLTYGKKNLLML